MTKLRVLQLTALIMLAFRPGSLAAQGISPVVCNDGKIPVSVARAYKDMHSWPSSGDWTVQGWYTVSSGECSAIGPEHYYTRGAEYSEATYSLTLLAFAFTDSTGVWGAARVGEPHPREAENVYKASNQQLCVQNQVFLYTRSTSQGEPAKECDRGLPGYYRIPASLAFYGENNAFVSKKTLHVSLGPNDRAIPSGTSGGAAPKTATPGGPNEGSGCLGASNVRSGGAVTSANIEFINLSAAIRRVYWLDSGGARQLMSVIQPGNVVAYDSWLTQAYMITDGADKCIAVYVVEKNGEIQSVK